MSKHMVTLTDIEARLKHYGVMITATGPEENEISVHIDGSDIRANYGCNPAQFVEKYEHDTETLFDLFHSVYGISYAD